MRALSLIDIHRAFTIMDEFLRDKKTVWEIVVYSALFPNDPFPQRAADRLPELEIAIRSET